MPTPDSTQVENCGDFWCEICSDEEVAPMPDQTVSVEDLVARLFVWANEVDVRTKSGGLALPGSSDREQRIYHHGIAVGIRSVALELEKGRTRGG